VSGGEATTSETGTVVVTPFESREIEAAYVPAARLPGVAVTVNVASVFEFPEGAIVSQLAALLTLKPTL